MADNVAAAIPAGAGPAPRAGRREWIGLAVIALPCALYAMDLTVLHLAVPQLSADLQPSPSELLWIIDIYGFLVAGSLITAGTLGDRIGRRRLLLIGAAFFAVASVLAAFSTSAEMLIATRALLGLAGATVAPSTLSLIRNMFLDAHQRTIAISVWLTSYSVGSAVGPLIGGMMLEYFWWGSVFLLAVPVMALLMVAAPLLLPEYRDPNAGRLDLFSVALSLAAVLAVIFGLKRIAEDGPSVLAVAIILAGVGLGVTFARRQLALADPLMDLKLFRLPGFSPSLALYGLGIVVMFGGFLFLPQYLQLVRGLSPFAAGLWTVPWAVAFVVGSLATPWLIRKISRPALLSAGFMLSALGFAVIARFDGATGFPTFLLATFVMSVGMAPAFTLTTDLVVGSAPPERAGAASAISETCAEFGGAVGIAVFGSIGVAIYRAVMADAALPGVPAMGDAAGTLGGAVELATELPAEVGRDLVRVAREAFMRGLRLCAWASVAGSLALAAVAAVSFRRPRPEH